MIRYRKWRRNTELESSQTYVENRILNTVTNIHSSIRVLIVRQLFLFTSYCPIVTIYNINDIQSKLLDTWNRATSTSNVYQSIPPLILRTQSLCTFFAIAVFENSWRAAQTWSRTKHLRGVFSLSLFSATPLAKQIKPGDCFGRCNKTGPRGERRATRRRAVISNNELWNIQAPARSWNAINRSDARSSAFDYLYISARFPVTGTPERPRRVLPDKRFGNVESAPRNNLFSRLEGLAAEGRETEAVAG